MYLISRAIKRPTSTPVLSSGSDSNSSSSSSSSSSGNGASDGAIVSKNDMLAPDLAVPKPNSILKKEATFKTPARNQTPSKAPALPSRTKTDASCSPPMLVRRAAHLQSPASTASSVTQVVPPVSIPVTEQSNADQQTKPLTDTEDMQKAVAPISNDLVRVNSIEIESSQVSVVAVPIQSPTLQTSQIEEEAVGLTIINANEQLDVGRVTSSPAMAVQEIIRELDAIPLPVSRHGSSKRKSKIKVDSGQQTTPKFQRSTSIIAPKANADKKEEIKTTAFK